MLTSFTGFRPSGGPRLPSPPSPPQLGSRNREARRSSGPPNEIEALRRVGGGLGRRCHLSSEVQCSDGGWGSAPQGRERIGEALIHASDPGDHKHHPRKELELFTTWEVSPPKQQGPSKATCGNSSAQRPWDGGGVRISSRKCFFLTGLGWLR